MSTRRLLHSYIWTAASYLTLPQHLAKPSLPAIVPFHILDTIPSPSINPLTDTYTTAAQRDKEQLLHTKSLQLPENKGLQTFRKTVECIVTVPSVSFETQVDENNKEIILKKLSTEIILGKPTEDTAMELDAEGGASFQQLQDLIKKECDKRDKKNRSLEQNYNKLQDSFNTSQPQKKIQNEGPTRRLKQKEITNSKSSTGPKPTWPPSNNKTATTYGSSPIPSRTARKSRRYQQRHYKRQSHKIKREQAITIAAEEKAFYHRSDQVATAITNKIKQKFARNWTINSPPDLDSKHPHSLIKDYYGSSLPTTRLSS